jgi:hypothetical protein
MLDIAYAWLEQHMMNRTWAVGDRFSLADCAAAPAMFYADCTHPIDQAFPNGRAYRNRLNKRASYAPRSTRRGRIARSSRFGRPIATDAWTARTPGRGASDGCWPVPMAAHV